MNRRVIKHFILFFQLWILSILVTPFLSAAFGLSEVRDLYSSPQALSMGNAITADAYGYLAFFANPAGLAKSPKRKYEIHIVDLDAIGSMNILSRWLSQKSTGTYQLTRGVQSNPSTYHFNQFSLVPAISMRNFGFSLLATHFYAAQSDGANVDIDAGQDVAPTFGWATAFAGNLIKLGTSVRVHIRNQIKGTFEHAALASDDAIKESSKEGIGVGINAGVLLTLPFRYLPTLGIAYNDILSTRFLALPILNKLSRGAPDPIPQSINTAFSVHPYLSRQLKSTIAVEVKHWERSDLIWQKKLHIGLQIADEKTFYIWLGMHQMFWSGGLAYRVDGGNLEFGSYAADVGAGAERVENRRFLFRYTVSFQ